MENKLIKATEYGLTPENGTKIENEFAIISTEQSGLIKIYNRIIKSEIDNELENEARILSIKLSKLNATNNKIHKSQKIFYLAGGKFVDALKNKNRDIISEMQERLEEIRNYSLNIRIVKIEKLKTERLHALERCESEIIPEKLGEMDTHVWESYILSQKTAYEKRKEIERKIEKNRIAKEKEEEKEHARIKEENEQLKKDVETRKKDETKRKAKEEAEQKKREEKDRKEREAHQEALRLEREKSAQIEAKAKVEREKLESELKAKEEAEQKIKRDEESIRQAELNKDDYAKVKDLILDLDSLKTKYTFKSAKNKKMYEDVNSLIDKVTNYINK